MNHIALYRKYRPTTFDEVFGQSAIVQTLRNQVKYDRVGHAYLFCGLRGSGKTSIARILAKAVNCEHTVDGNPCGKCEHCNFKNDVNPDIIEIDAASNNGVDSIRQLIDEVNYKPTNTKYKVYIIDEVHMLSGSAFNALLKTVEEPPDHAIFILATTEYNKVPSTIKSRCQIYNFKLINQDDIVLGLENVLAREGITYFEKDALEYVARKADGSMRDAISILDQCIAQHNGTQQVTISEVKQLFGDIEDDVVIELAQCVERVDVIRGLDILHAQHYDGRNIKLLLDDLYHYYFNKFTTVFGTNEGIVFERYARILGETISALDHSSRKMTMAEIAFIKMCKPEMESDYNSVVQRMNNLESELAAIKSNNVSISVDKVDNVVDKQEKFDRNVTLYYNSPWNYLLRTQ